ncbi:spore maturation protein [Effusibacillus lacus]|uniref:Spore maturation protein n=1 Tax=Effusibacillus lacus TaxID=1348429 RepID=A0A292YPG6_9BACL|nr:spore maturation protein [Effusibacillus lacus]TCS76290.1 spore maturation protein B [Effusibacillus lacus]GAX91838.1 spore maturation protein [Effusibacillus lacus]
MMEWINTLSEWALPIVVASILVIGHFRKVPVYETFVEGAKEGFPTAIKIIPHLVAMMVAVSVFRESGALDMLLRLLRPVFEVLSIPVEIIPMALLRPISGSGSSAVMFDIFQTYGPDSLLGRIASVLQGSSDTTLYVLTVYFGSVGIRNARYAVKVGLLSDLAAAIFSVLVVYWVFDL